MMRLAKWPSILLLGVLLAFLAVAVACGDDDDDDDGAGESLAGNLTVFAAASLTGAFTEIGEALEADNPDLSIEFNFASSSALRTQIEEGAPADVFASADLAQMEQAIEGDLVEGEGTLFVRNLPVIVVPTDDPAGIESYEDLATPGIRLVLAAEDVPIGRYARQIFANVEAASPGYEAAVMANVVSNEANVRAVLTKIELGEGDAGIVYVTDARVSGDAVESIEIPEEYNVIAEYPIAVLTEAADPALAQTFIEYVLSRDGQAVLQSYGFEPAAE
jgi:molybdate transport system substrate-binding protein